MNIAEYKQKIFGYDNIVSIMKNKSKEFQDSFLNGIYSTPNIKSLPVKNIIFNKFSENWLYCKVHVSKSRDHELEFPIFDTASESTDFLESQIKKESEIIFSLVESTNFENLSDRIVFSNNIRRNISSKYLFYKNSRTNNGFIIINESSLLENHSCFSTTILSTKSNNICRSPHYPSVFILTGKDFSYGISKVTIEEHYFVTDEEKENLFNEGRIRYLKRSRFGLDLSNAKGISGEISKLEIPVYKFANIILNNNKKIIVPQPTGDEIIYHTCLFLGKISNLKNIEFLNNVSTKSITGDFFLEYVSASNVVKIFRRVLNKKKLKDIWKSYKNPVMPSIMYSLENEFYCSFDYENKTYDLDKTTYLFFEKIKNYNLNPSVKGKLLFSLV